LGQRCRRRGISAAAGGGGRGNAVSGEEAALEVDKARAGRVEQVLGEAPRNSHGAGVEWSKGFGGGAIGGWRRTRGRTAVRCGWRENTTAFYTRWLGVTAA
jgi:hypothetical protein